MIMKEAPDDGHEEGWVMKTVIAILLSCMLALSFMLALSCMLATPVLALMDEGVNSLGVYFEPSGDSNCCNPVRFAPFNVYFVLAHPTAAKLAGYEFAWRISPLDPAPIILSKTFAPGAVNAGLETNLLVTIAGGLATTEATVLVSYSLMALSPIDFSYVTVGPATPAAVPGHAACFGLMDTAPTAMAFHGVPGWATLDSEGWVVPGVAQLGGCTGPPPAAMAATWSAVKSLFR